MAVYRYKGVNGSGKAVSGIRDVEGERALQHLLRKEGVFPTEISKQRENQAQKPGEINLGRYRTRVSPQEVAVVTRQLATLLHAGVTLVESLGALVDQTENVHLKLVLSQVKQRVNEGSSLAEALGQHRKIFPDIYCNMVRAGESSGALDVVLTRLADFTESQARLRSKIFSASFYPMIMIFVGVIILGILMIYVLPKITKIFEDREEQLPVMTKILLATTDFFSNYWWLVLLLIFSLIAFHLWYIKTESGGLRWDRFKLRAPIFGEVIRMLAIARFSKTLATLMRSGVPLLNAFTIVRNIVNNRIMSEAIDEAKESIREGESVAAPLKRSGQFPPLVIHMIAVGERSGQLEDMLDHVAKSYEEQADVRISTLTTLLEPILILAMAGGVGFIIFSILPAIMQLNEFAK